VERLHLDEEGLVWAQQWQVELWAMDNKRPVRGLLLDVEKPLRDEVVGLGAGDVQAARGELPQVVEDLQHTCKGLGALMPQFS